MTLTVRLPNEPQYRLIILHYKAVEQNSIM